MGIFSSDLPYAFPEPKPIPDTARFDVLGGQGLRRLANNLTHDQATAYVDQLESRCERDGFTTLKTMIIRSK